MHSRQKRKQSIPPMHMKTRLMRKKTNYYYQQPDEIRTHQLFQFFEPKEVVRLSTVSTLFNKDTQCDRYWRDRLIAAGLDQKLLEIAAQTGSISNYKNLYHSQLRWVESEEIQPVRQLWELLCVSGEVRAIDYAIQNNVIHANTRNSWGGTPLLLTAYSGSAKAMDRVYQIQGIDPFAKTETGANVAHLAVLSGNIAAIERVAAMKGIDFKLLINGFNIFHIAVFSKNPEAVILLRKLNISHQLGLNPDRKNDKGITAIECIPSYIEAPSLQTAFREAFMTPIEMASLAEEKIQPVNVNRLRIG